MTGKTSAVLALLAALAWACPDEKYCLACDEASIEKVKLCGVCENSFPLANGKCAPDLDLQVPNCVSYVMDSVRKASRCVVCGAGFRLSRSRNECIACLPDCSRCSARTDECLGCYNGRHFDVAARTCAGSRRCDIANCEVCGVADESPQDLICHLCDQRFATTRDDKKQCRRATEGCVQLRSPDSPNDCVLCYWGYYLASDGTCKGGNRPGPSPDPKPDPSPDPKPDPSPEPQPIYKKWWFWAAIAGVVLVVGAVLFVKSRQDYEVYNVVRE